MTEEFDRLKQDLDRAAPAPDAARKAAALSLAMKNFDARQEIADQTRQTSDRPETGLFRGVKTMFANLSNRGLLTASTALVAAALVVAIPALREGPGPVLMPEPAVIGQEQSDLDALAGRDAAPARVAKEAENMDDMTLSAPAEAPAADEVEGLVATEEMPPQASAPMARMSQKSVREDGFVAPLPAPAPAPEPVIRPEADTEAYPQSAQKPLKVTAEEPVSTFSIDVDTASYPIIRNSLMTGQLPPEGAVRVEEVVNYFSYDYPAPEGDAAFRTALRLTDTPWNPGTQLIQIGIQGAMPAIEDRPPLNLVFLIDTSGSMDQLNKLPLLVQSFRLMLGQLRPEDEVSIVTYAGSAGQVLEPTPASERQTILNALTRLRAGGSTAGQAGLQQAYDVAQGMAGEGEVTRVILATDGDFNVGLSDPAALKEFIAEKRDSGTYLSVLGFGRGNLDDATMQALAQNGNGTAAYIDTLSEAQKVLVDQLTGALFPIANDVKIQVEFNPAAVAEYRLIGYETRALRREDFNNDKIDAGEIGAGHQVTALYEITPVGSDAVRNTPLRYANEETTLAKTDELGFFRLRYKTPGDSRSQLIETPITQELRSDAGDGFAVAMAGFAELLRGSDYLGDWGWEDAIALARAEQGDDPFGYRREALSLMRLAQSLSAR